MSLSTSRLRSAEAARGSESGISAERLRPRAGRLSAMVLLLWANQRRAVPRQHLAGEREIRLRAAGFHVVDDGREAMARRLSEPDVPRDDHIVDALLEERA